MSTIYAIDPGPTQSAFLALAVSTAFGGGIVGRIWDNDLLVEHLRDAVEPSGHLVIEQIESMGMAVGAETFETVFWSGRFAQAWQEQGYGYSWSRLTRRQVKLHLCCSMRAKDANIRQALIDKFGGSTCTKKGGVLYGIRSHCWAALAVGVTYRETVATENSKTEAAHA